MSIFRQRIPEHAIPGRRLGRHVHHDDRSAAYPAQLAPEIISVTHASRGLPLNQGDTGSCTAEALTGCLNTAPDCAATVYGQDDARALYAAEVALEGGTFPPDDPGGSGLRVCQAAKGKGLISSYTHVFTAEDALRALVLRPGMFGVNWYSSFDAPDASGIVSVTPGATVRGGHEICAYGLDVTGELIWFWNSWGPGFGIGGTFAMRFATAERLHREDGDVVFPVR